MTIRLLPILLLLPLSASAADWPQWRGPHRDGISSETGLLKSWPLGGPKLLWTLDDAGAGYSGPAVVGDRLFTMGAFKDQECVFAVDVPTGKKVWTTPVGPLFDNPWGRGPRATPSVSNGLVYALSATGVLLCARADTGAKVWSVDLVKDLGGVQKVSAFTWGYSESPLVEDGRVILSPGGPRGTLAGLDSKSGKVLWRSTGWIDESDYSSVVGTTIQGVRQVVQMTSDSVAGVAALDGALLWRFPRAARITVPTPLCFDNKVYVTSGYDGVGCALIEIQTDSKKFSAKAVYDEGARKVMHNVHGGVIRVDGHVYGYSDPRGWLCQDVKTGRLVWLSREFDKGSLVRAGERFYCFGQGKGTCGLIDASPAGWVEKGRFSLPKTSNRPRPPRQGSGNFWTHPVVANGRLYLRDQEMLFCFDVKER